MVKSKSVVSQLAKHLGIGFTGADVELSGLSSIASEVEPGDLFVALPGASYHGLEFLEEAKKRGAVAVLSDKTVHDMPSLVSDEPRALLGEASNLIMGIPRFPLFAVTGTNGKTSTANYIYQLLSNLGARSGMAGSNGLELPSGHRPSSLTSVELTTLRKYLRDLQDQGGQACSVEVSAHALVRNRVAGLEFEVAGFTNLSRDHLDDFGDMDNYFAAKAKLFDPSMAKQAAIFISDTWAEALLSTAQIPALAVGPGHAVNFEYRDQTLILSGEITLSVTFPFGELMARNLALAIAMLHLAGYSDSELAAAARGLTQVPGRLQRVSEAMPAVFVDYAHTPDAIHSAIEELSKAFKGVTVLVSASGDRDKGKRFEMGVAATGASQVILTDQHPRSEDPAQIRAAVAEGLASSDKPFTEIADPAKAIEFAVSVTPRDHAVLWCGPGNLKYREIAGAKHPFDAIALAKLAVEALD